MNTAGAPKQIDLMNPQAIESEVLRLTRECGLRVRDVASALQLPEQQVVAILVKASLAASAARARR